MSTVSNLPQPGVVINLDLEERDPKDVKPPFIAEVGGRTIEMLDPADIDWRDLASVQIPADILRVAMSSEDVAYLQTTPLTSFKFNRLMEAYYKHYDLDSKIAEARRQQAFANGRAGL